jgi:hypothetical protein
METVGGRDQEKNGRAVDIPSWLRHTWCGADPLLILYKTLMRARIECGSFLIHVLYNSQKVLIKKTQLKALKKALGLRSSTLANIVLGRPKFAP